MTKSYQDKLKTPLAEEIFDSHYNELFAVLPEDAISDDFSTAKKNSDKAGMIAAVAKFYREKAAWAPIFNVPEKADIEKADKIAQGQMREINVDWEFENGDVDFNFNPTTVKPPLNHEWLWHFNRMSYWPNLAAAYAETGDEKYAEAFTSHVLHWIVDCHAPETRWNEPGSTWRTIECGLRLMGNWELAFGVFRRSKTFTDEALVLMIASMHRQAKFLVKHPTRRNWLMMEMCGAYTFASLFPELSDAEEIRTFAGNLLISDVEEQLLPDGYQFELSPDYHGCVYHCAYNLYKIAVTLGRENELPKQFEECLKRACFAAIQTSTPAFSQPNLNDCDSTFTKEFTQTAATIFPDVPEFEFVNSDRKAGHAPQGETASVFMPYAGYAVMRNDWSADSLYLLFDVGPLGVQHYHEDKLNIDMFRGDEELIFDDGGGEYEISDMRKYAVSGYDHNTVLVDGMAQSRKEPGKYVEPVDAHYVSTSEYDYAMGTYDGEFGEGLTPATHTREVRMCKPGFVFVKDTCHSIDGKEHDYEMLLHTDTVNVHAIAEYQNALLGEFGKTYDILIVPVSGVGEISVLSGETEPRIFGWYVGRGRTTVHPATTVIRKQSGTDCTFETLLIPVRHGDKMPKIDVSGDRVEVLFEGKNYVFDKAHLDR